MNRGRYVDLQVNGYAGVDFNSDGLTPDALDTVCDALERDGVAAILAAIVTDAVPVMAERLRRLVALRARSPRVQRLIPGLHIEGPFLNEAPGFRGAHPADAIHPANCGDMQQLLDAGGGLVRLVTLAPERDPGLTVTKMLARQGIIVSGGHSDATIDQLDEAIDAGLSMWTHLGNGCPLQMHRHDNVIQRVLSRSDRLTLCFIADGVHVPFFTLRNYLRLADPDRCVVVTDAMAAAGLGPGKYRLGRWELDIGEDLAAWAPDRSHLVGSAVTMKQAEANLRGKLALPAEMVARLVVGNPHRLLCQPVP